MHLFLLGVSHHSAPVELRERIDFSRRGVSEALRSLSETPGTLEVVVLSTCNRAEIYSMCESPEQARSVLSHFMSSFHDVPESDLAAHLYGRTDADAVRHLFRVTAGLDSLVIGEPQICGQVKDAYTIASEYGCTSATLHRLFHWSFSVGKRVRNETGLGEGAVSVSYATISLARKIFGSLINLRALIVGAGEMAELTATHLHAQNVKQISVANRTAAHAESLAAKVQGVAVPWESIPDELASADIVVAATGSSSWMISRAQVSDAVTPRRDKPLFIIDIGVPRDVEPSAGDVEQVFLFNIDDLKTIVRENFARRQSQVDRAELMIGEEVKSFMLWLRSRGAIPTVVALRQRFENIRQSELHRLDSKLGSMSPESRAKVEEITRLLVEKLLSIPTDRLKSAADDEIIAKDADTLTRLFDLDPQSDAVRKEASESSENRSQAKVNEPTFFSRKP